MSTSMEARRARARSAMVEAGVEALLVTDPLNRRYLTGLSGTAGSALLTADRQILLTDFRYVEQAKQEAPDWELVQYEDFYPELGKLLGQLQVGRVGFESHKVTVKQHQDLQAKTGARVEWVPLEGLVERLRAIKSAEELALLRQAVAIADAAFTHIVGFLRPGVTEREVAVELEFFMRRQGAEGLAFPSIIGSGPNGALPHARPSQRPLAIGDLVVLDFGAVWQGYHSDITRTVAIGRVDEEQRAIYELVRQAQAVGVAAVQPGREGREVDAEARRVIQEAGYGDYFGHGLGHGVGLEVHEDPPRLSRLSESRLEPGMVTSVEPGIYLPGRFGVRIEDLVVVTADGPQVLTQSSKELIIC